ncbi:hypothetical protein [Sinomonas sp. ASV322]|nr:hypothetical protein [Sinomonas sp. ASV322]MDQ4500755.1 hypothetical protein [Sinomonas sp. ASV322]
MINAAHVNQPLFAFQRYEDNGLSYTNISSPKELQRFGLYDTFVAMVA